VNDVVLIKIKEEILSENKEMATTLRARLTDQGVRLVNVMASPGAGKTSFILQTLHHFSGRLSMAVVEGDVDSTVDAEKILTAGFQAVQIQTGGSCHLSAAMVDRALEDLDLEGLDLVFVENIGNLICPASHDTGAHLNLVLSSLPEGDDKPLKYPGIFRGVDAVILNKVDTHPVFSFDEAAFTQRVARLNAQAPVFPVSCTTGEGFSAWHEWLEDRLGPRE
jgi:hydrogenase nickel incorporation protein HypB